MKKYFAKYLPVEEKIKIGDTIMHIGSKLVHVNCSTALFAIGAFDNFQSYIKLRLFLCSRDIQVGDKVWNVDSGYGIVKEVTQEEAFLGVKYDKQEFIVEEDFEYIIKVIAPISENAAWVKEGDEFEEEEIKRDVVTKWYAGEDDYTEYVHHHPKGDEKFINTEDKFISEDPIKIKCPCCGDFK